MKNYTQGIFKQISPQFGLVTTRDGEEFFIAKFDANGAFPGDTVNIRVKKPALGGKKAEAVITNIVKRTQEPLVCVCKKKYKSNELVALPYRSSANTTIVIVGKKERVRSGDIVSVRITSGIDRPVGIIEKYIGNENENDIEERIILIQNNISFKFPDEVIHAADKLHSPKPSQKRLDIRNLFTVTIDGEDAKDLDDAISVNKLESGNFELWVHIADVAEYVSENNAIDIEALKRGTSIYLPDSVIPMLPEKLSNDLCSLNPGQNKATLSIRLELDKQGQVKKSELFETLIQSDYRLTYTHVADVLDGKIPEEKIPPLLNKLINEAFELKKILDIRRKKEGKIDFDLPEIKVMLGKDKRVTDVKKQERNEAHKIIEEFMVLANEEVSRFFATKKIPFLYRTHDMPDEEALKKIANIAAQYGHLFDARKPKPRDINFFLESIREKPYEYHVARLTLHAMARAQYSDKVLGHYGLALMYYSHFTSPIRRYPDLQIHRIIKEYLHDSLDDTRIRHFEHKLKNVAINCSNTERKAESIERGIKELKIIEYMERFIGKTFTGVISHIVEAGVSVELESGVEGFIHESTFPIRYTFDEERQVLKAKKQEDNLFIGKPISVLVTEANKKSRRLAFAFSKK